MHKANRSIKGAHRRKKNNFMQLSLFFMAFIPSFSFKRRRLYGVPLVFVVDIHKRNAVISVKQTI